MENKISLTKLGTYAGSTTAILALLWYIGEPALERYVDSHINTYEERRTEEESAKVGLRHLLGDKMGLADDEVHIELGRQYKREQAIISQLDTLTEHTKELTKKIIVSTKTINKLESDNVHFRRQLDNYGLFH